jgi:transposase
VHDPNARISLKNALFNTIAASCRCASHHLVEPVACTPGSGWEKGQVENQVGLVRERFFTPRLREKSYDELNDWLMDKCIAWAKAHSIPNSPTGRSGGVRERASQAHSLSWPLRRFQA